MSEAELKELHAQLQSQSQTVSTLSQPDIMMYCTAKKSTHTPQAQTDKQKF